MILNQEEKFKLIFDSLKEKKTEQTMFNAFLDRHPEEWKQLKVTFSKFNRRSSLAEQFRYQNQKFL